MTSNPLPILRMTIAQFAEDGLNGDMGPEEAVYDRGCCRLLDVPLKARELLATLPTDIM